MEGEVIGFRLKNTLSSSALAKGEDVLRMKGALQGLGDYDPPAYGMTEWPDAPLFDGMKRFQHKNGLAVDGVAKPGGPTETMINTRLAEQALGRKQAEEPQRQAQNQNQDQDQDDPTDIGAMANRIAQRQAQWQKTQRQKTQRQKTQPQPASQATQQTGPSARSSARSATTPALTLRGGVGDGQGNQPDDIITLKNALAWTGHYPKDRTQLLTPFLDEALTWGLHRFQRDFGLTQDGITRPNGETESRLNEVITPMIQLAAMEASDDTLKIDSAPQNAGKKQHERHFDVGRQPKIGGRDGNQSGDSSLPVLNMPGERRRSIIDDTPAIFGYATNDKADDSSPVWEDRGRGADAVRKHDATIIEIAQRHGVDPDLVRSIMYMENARGHWYGVSYILDDIGLSDTIMPMNINPELWGDLLGRNADFNNPAQNIEAATILLKRISDRLEHPSLGAIASIWNYLGRETPNDLGAYVQRVYDSKMWEPQVGP